MSPRKSPGRHVRSKTWMAKRATPLFQVKQGEAARRYTADRLQFTRTPCLGSCELPKCMIAHHKYVEQGMIATSSQENLLQHVHSLPPSDTACDTFIPPPNQIQRFARLSFQRIVLTHNDHSTITTMHRLKKQLPSIHALHHRRQRRLHVIARP